MLFSTSCASLCSFDPTVTSVNDLKNCFTNKDKEFCSTDFGGWVALPPRKRRTKQQLVLDSDGNKIKPEKSQIKFLKTDTYYKRYRVDPMEGTFKHYKNHGQYMQLYRETTTLCYKQKTLHELTAMYSAALDINSERGHAISGYTYYLDTEPSRELGQTVSQADLQTTIYSSLNIPSISSPSETGIPLMLLPTAPSIPTRDTRVSHQYQAGSIGSATFMCNAFMNRSLVCPVHRIIHRRIILNGTGRCRSHVDLCPDHEHIKVTLPGIPKRRCNVHAKRLKDHRDSNPILGLDHEASSQMEALPPSKVVDEEEDADCRINKLLSTNNVPSPSERVSKALQQRRMMTSMQLPVTALLQYSPKFQDEKSQVKKKPLSLKSRRTRLVEMESKKKKSETTTNSKPKPEVKQVIIETHANSYKPLECKPFSGIGESCLRVSSLSTSKYWLNYERQYEKFFSDVLESKGRYIQKKHFQSMCNGTKIGGISGDFR